MVLAFFSVLMMRTADKGQTSPFYVSMLIAAALMYVVNRMRRHLSANFLRLSSDLILLIAALFFFILH
jgi:predicted PurR-regulated permease PerM